jgi:hypothetical protein
MTETVGYSRLDAGDVTPSWSLLYLLLIVVSLCFLICGERGVAAAPANV